MTGRAVLLAAVLLGLAGPAVAADELAASRIKYLRHLVEQDCGSCHGLTRQGGLGSPLTMQVMQELGDEALIATILDGRPGTPMPPWRGLLSEQDARWIVTFLKGQAG